MTAPQIPQVSVVMIAYRSQGLIFMSIEAPVDHGTQGCNLASDAPATPSSRRAGTLLMPAFEKGKRIVAAKRSCLRYKGAPMPGACFARGAGNRSASAGDLSRPCAMPPAKL